MALLHLLKNTMHEQRRVNPNSVLIQFIIIDWGLFVFSEIIVASFLMTKSHYLPHPPVVVKTRGVKEAFSISSNLLHKISHLSLCVAFPLSRGSKISLRSTVEAHIISCSFYTVSLFSFFSTSDSSHTDTSSSDNIYFFPKKRCFAISTFILLLCCWRTRWKCWCLFHIVPPLS